MTRLALALKCGAFAASGFLDCRGPCAKLSLFSKEAVTGETAEKLEMIQTDATPISIPVKEIETRKLQDQSPMPPGLVKTPEELRDLLAFLLGS